MPEPVRRFFLLGFAVATLVVLVGVGFLAWIGTEGGLVPVPPITPGASDIQDLYVFVGAFASFVFLVVTVPLALFVIGFRRRGRSRRDEGPQIRGNTRLELIWTAIPVLILAAIAAFTFYKLPGIRTPTAEAGDAELTIQVEGHQFYWRYVYPNGAVSYDRLYAPVDTDVVLNVTAPDHDVIHSWWVPALGGKVDAIPAVVNELGFRATRTGIFPGRCAELCGIQHAVMDFDAQVMEQAEFRAWLEGAAPDPEPVDLELGRRIFEVVCSKCHFAAPEYAPNIAGNPLLDRPEALAEIVVTGRGRMPAVGATWSEPELEALLAYAQVLAGGAGE